MGNAYRDAGVDVERGYRAVELMKTHVQSTYHEGCWEASVVSAGWYP